MFRDLIEQINITGHDRGVDYAIMVEDALRACMKCKKFRERFFIIMGTIKNGELNIDDDGKYLFRIKDKEYKLFSLHSVEKISGLESCSSNKEKIDKVLALDKKINKYFNDAIVYKYKSKTNPLFHDMVLNCIASIETLEKKIDIL